MQRAGFYRRLVVGGAAICLTLPAFADIKSFNAAMQTKDYRKAAAEAASTWSTLDKSRVDLPVIANEFGFASLMATDYEAARTFAMAALGGGGDNAFRVSAELLLRLSEFKLTPSGATRDKLQTALEASATLPGVDLMSFVGVNALTSYDIENDNWRAAKVSAALGENLTGRGKGKPTAENLIFSLIRASATYVIDRDMASYLGLVSLNDKVTTAIEGASSEEEAAKFEPAFWQVRAWEESASAQLQSDRDFKRDKAYEIGGRPKGPRVARLYLQEPQEGVCKLTVPTFAQPVPYPTEARRSGVAGAVIVKVDVQENGLTKNMRILAAVPQRYFGDAIYGVGNRITFTKTKDATPGCSLAQNGKVFTYIFTMR